MPKLTRREANTIVNKVDNFGIGYDILAEDYVGNIRQYTCPDFKRLLSKYVNTQKAFKKAKRELKDFVETTATTRQSKVKKHA